MIDAIGDTYLMKLKAVDLLNHIAEADTQFEAICVGHATRTLVWVLESHRRISSLDADNLLVVFQSALEKRLHELTPH
ncbi:hypothetical protein SAMN04489798_2529 [Pseudomonas arsenicoxydans]|uniref:Uncharacterized protein n=1 Tax=Pseudomonas arsenicoxydans TaxID=702115 RepID=A0A1H0I8F5_9PSED|nr:hypothetical protein [Pseudomonas arsenicoxydans]SDO27655.1 hypothetical protein SAMN04489798_2529 [Pseudomonas arsenicoxydans]